MSDLPTHYPLGDHAARYAAWQSAGCFTPTAAAQRFAMILPPPNITGRLHLGHAYEHALSDALTRHQRMSGAETLWLPGTDHAGIATQALIEKALTAEGTSRAELGREAFLDRTWAWTHATGDAIADQMRALGSTPDWSRAAFTLDAGPARATHEAFTRLFRQGLIYRAQRATAWCTRCQTHLSDIETQDRTDSAGRCCTRCGAAIEERTSAQWFLATATLAEHARTALTSGALRLDPADAAADWLRWLDDIGDWCLSRQLWWGHRIPIWYGPDGQAHSFAPGEDIPHGWTQDEDCLDTWFSSALWPLSTLGWPEPTADLARYYPTDLLITGTDLIFFWAIRMTMLCTHLAGQPPFARLYLHGMLRDEHGKKMSKSFGNTIDPLDWAAEYGPDALRLALTSRARPGADIPFGASDIRGAKALLNKLWSITRLAAGAGIGLPAPDPGRPQHLLDRWILSRAERARAQASAAFADLDLAAACHALSRFTLEDLSDRYLQARKRDLGTDPDARAALAACLEQLLLLLHPIAPFLTEEAHEALGGTGFLDERPWPAPRPERIDPAAETAADDLWELLRAARAYRDARGIPQGQSLPGAISGTSLAGELAALARISPAEIDPHQGATLTSGTATLTLHGAANPAAMAARLERARAGAAALQARLDDPAFLANAPAATQEKERARLAQARADLARLEALT